MYAIVKTGGKQYKVAEGDIIKVEKLEAKEGSVVALDCCLLNTDNDVLVGADAAKATVEAKVLGNGKEKKVVVYKYKPKTGYHKKQGHRQPYTELKVEAIKA